MKKQLLTVGDSFTYGDELDDVYQAWPYKLAEKLGYEVHNIGQSGCGNASILRRTLEELSTIMIYWLWVGQILEGLNGKMTLVSHMISGQVIRLTLSFLKIILGELSC
jgi:hypothetical protein